MMVHAILPYFKIRIVRDIENHDDAFDDRLIVLSCFLFAKSIVVFLRRDVESFSARNLVFLVDEVPEH